MLRAGQLTAAGIASEAADTEMTAMEAAEFLQRVRHRHEGPRSPNLEYATWAEVEEWFSKALHQRGQHRPRTGR
ncbi:hypothetical protein ACFQPG_11480 [Sphingomonas sp. GCM10030256]|uniref:hypothetical protein n=1 Tax=Sphingomonas sp. GCM10030256 TaxID=3273427 RepID=UPI0036178EE7